MANPTWDNATLEEKAEMLRDDVGAMSEAHNRLSNAHVQLQQQVADMARELEALRRKIEDE